MPLHTFDGKEQFKKKKRPPAARASQLVSRAAQTDCVPLFQIGAKYPCSFRSLSLFVDPRGRILKGTKY